MNNYSCIPSKGKYKSKIELLDNESHWYVFSYSIRMIKSGTITRFASHLCRGVPTGVEVVVVPATAQNVKEQHVRVTLVISLPPEYPDASPSITLRYCFNDPLFLPSVLVLLLLGPVFIPLTPLPAPLDVLFWSYNH